MALIMFADDDRDHKNNSNGNSNGSVRISSVRISALQWTVQGFGLHGKRRYHHRGIIIISATKKLGIFLLNERQISQNYFCS